MKNTKSNVKTSEKKVKMSPLRKIERLDGVRAVRTGLMNTIPVLIIGAFALILNTFPVDAYQNAINTFAGGFLVQLFDAVNKATFGVLSIYMTFAISRSYMKIKADPDAVQWGAQIASVISFFILAGVTLPDFGTDSTGPKSMFLAIITALLCSYLYLKISRFFKDSRHTLFSSGADREFNQMLSTLLPVALIVVFIALADLLITRAFNETSFRSLIATMFNRLFSHGKVDFFKGFFFVLLSSVLWMFGIHGSDTLEGVMQTYFVPGLAANQAAIEAGGAPSAVLTKEFFDCFVLMGGCGSAICLLVAILIISRNRARRGLAYTAAFPMIFNINELMVFGLPIIFNPIMLVPFLTVPLVCYSSAYIAISSGLVPMISSQVEWTTPVILGGLRATGSAAGAFLQVFNLVLGVLIYLPFVRLLDKRTEEEAKNSFETFMEHFKKNEELPYPVRITEKNDTDGEIARNLAAEIRHNAGKNMTLLAYQPQYDYSGKCIGAEALLRRKHPLYGNLYPPLVIKLAEEGGFLIDLEEGVVRRVLLDLPAVRAKFGADIKVSFNVTGTTVVSDRFIQYLRQLNANDPFAGKNICIEITEQAALTFNEYTKKALEEIKSMGIALAIDDFSMGHTSINYLKDNMFDVIKLDGSLVRGMSTHANCLEIISSIVRLSSSLNLTVLAEYVETEQDRENLHNVGCNCYQGYLYSPAVFL